MKILIDARMYGLENTGIGRYLMALIEELKKKESKDHYFVLLRKRYFDSLSFPQNWDKVLADIPHYTLREQLLIPNIINRIAPDLVHFPHLNVPVLYKGKYVLTVHDLTMQKQGRRASKLPLPFYIIKRLPFLLIARYAVKNAVKVIVPSKSTATDLANYYNKTIQQIVTIYEGYSFGKDVKSKILGELSILSKYGLVNGNYFFYIGNAYPHKNLEVAVKAIKDLRENKKVDVKFVIAGLKDYFQVRLKNYINDLGANEYIITTGYIKDEELPVLYKNSLGFVYPSLSEGFGLQGLEAISMGTTLACSNISVFKEIYEFHAFYFNPKDVASISSTLFSIYNMKREDKHKYIRSAQKFIQKYSWAKMAEETVGEYEKATRDKR